MKTITKRKLMSLIYNDESVSTSLVTAIASISNWAPYNNIPLLILTD